MKRLMAIGIMLAVMAGLFPARVRGAEPAVSAKSALLMELSTGQVLFEQNSHERLAPASVTKVMTMLLIMEAIDSGSLSWSDTVTASEAAAKKGGSQVYLKVGETMTVEEMVKSIAVSSANDCACAMAEHLAGSEAAFVEKMNQRAAELGMQDTHFVNCTGLDDSPEAREHRTSAYDIALMSRELLKNHPDIKKYTTIWMDTVRNGAFGLSNTNKLVRFYSGTTGLKTGFTAGAGYCLSASANRDGMELIAVVMGCETSQDRFSSCKAMLDMGFAGYAVITPEISDVADVPVALGKAQAVPVRLGNAEGFLIDKGQKSTVTTHTELADTVPAPVSQGQRLGTLTIRSGEQILAQIPLVAAEGVEKLSFYDLFRLVLSRACMAKSGEN